MSTPLWNRLLRRALLCSIVLSMCLVLAPGTFANVRLPSGDLPLYAQIPCPDCVQHNDEQAVIPFYGPPSCVPPDFNLLNYFDPGAFACTPPTTEGFEIWEHGPELDPVPLVWQLHGLGAVPVWFVRWPELQAAMADGELKIGELKGLPSLLRGTAGSYKQTARNEGMLSIVVLQISARGMLEDGRAFQVETVAHGPDLNQNTRIVFRQRVMMRTLSTQLGLVPNAVQAGLDTRHHESSRKPGRLNALDEQIGSLFNQENGLLGLSERADYCRL